MHRSIGKQSEKFSQKKASCLKTPRRRETVYHTALARQHH